MIEGADSYPFPIEWSEGNFVADGAGAFLS